jgi:hypothetical protein
LFFSRSIQKLINLAAIENILPLAIITTMIKFIVAKSMNYSRTVIGSYDSYQDAKQQVDLAASSHRAIYGDDNTLSKTENSASKYPYKIEITEMTHEAGLIKDVYYVERRDDDLPY